MIIYEPGDVITVPFPSSDLSGIKKRPALILASFQDKREIICLMLTSVPARDELEYPLRFWKEAGLLKPTTARLHRLFTISFSMVKSRLGRLKKEEYTKILSKVVDLLGKGV